MPAFVPHDYPHPLPIWHPQFPRRSGSLLRHQGARSAPAGTGGLNLDRRAGNDADDGAGNLVEVGQLLDLTVLALDPGKMRRPDVATVPGAFVVRGHGGEGPVQRVSVDADDLHPLTDPPEDALSAQARLGEIVRRIQP